MKSLWAESALEIVNFISKIVNWERERDIAHAFNFVVAATTPSALMNDTSTCVLYQQQKEFTDDSETFDNLIKIEKLKLKFPEGQRKYSSCSTEKKRLWNCRIK